MNNSSNLSKMVYLTKQGTPVTDTIRVANLFRNGKTNNVYRQALRLANITSYKDEFFDLHQKPSAIVMTKRGFIILTSRFTRKGRSNVQIFTERVIAEFDKHASNIILQKPEEANLTKIQHKEVNEHENADYGLFEKVQKPIIKGKHPLSIAYDDFTAAQSEFKRIYETFKAKSEIFQYELNKFVVESWNKDKIITDLQNEIDALKRNRPKTTRIIQTTSENILVRELAIMASANGVNGMGEIRLFEWLRKFGYVCANGESRNMPTQYAIDLGILTVKYSDFFIDGKTKVSKTTIVTPKGQKYFINKMLYAQENPITNKLNNTNDESLHIG